MSNTIDKIKPSKTNPFEGEFDGSEIVLVTRPKIGTYKAPDSFENSIMFNQDVL